MKLPLQQLAVQGKTVLMRVDFNVPMNNGNIMDDSRIRASLPSIQYVLDHGGTLILLSHLGRPQGKPDPALTLAPCAKRLSEMLHQPVKMLQLGEKVEGSKVYLLENLRFFPGEEDPENHPDFVKSLAQLGDCYVNDAFGTAHRAHASTAAITQFFPHKSAMGFLIEKEIEKLSPLLKNPPRPFYAIIGGSKISTKIGVIQELLKKVDALFIGGGMFYTFLKARGIEIGDSIAEDPKTIENIPQDKLRFPKDLVIADRFSNDANIKIIAADAGIPKGWQGMDMGPLTQQAWADELKKAATVFWNGPVGVFEMPHFAKGTKAIAECLANAKAKTIVGGGDSVAAIEQMGLEKKFEHLSTGGGASLEFLEFGHLPGIDVLDRN